MIRPEVTGVNGREMPDCCWTSTRKRRWRTLGTLTYAVIGRLEKRSNETNTGHTNNATIVDVNRECIVSQYVHTIIDQNTPTNLSGDLLRRTYWQREMFASVSKNEIKRKENIVEEKKLQLRRRRWGGGSSDAKAIASIAPRWHRSRTENNPTPTYIDFFLHIYFCTDILWTIL